MMIFKKCKWLLGSAILSISAFANAGSVWSWIDGQWYQIPSNPELESSFFLTWPHIVGNTRGGLPFGLGDFKLDKKNGYVIWEYAGNGPAPTGPGTENYSFDGVQLWKAIDNNQRTVKIVSQNGKLYQLHNHGPIWAFTNRQWIRIDSNSRTVDIVIASGVLYQLHDNGDIWMYNHNLCLDSRLGNDCWIRIDNNRGATRAIKEDGGHLLQLHY
jgi:hypothetical protein